MSATVTVDPASRSASSWSASLASLKSRHVAESDPRIAAAREGLAYHRVRRSIVAEAGQLSPAGVDRLVSALREAAAR
ncbi:hypothetical protein ACXPWS_12850 [Mycobacterium sp. BMJ-28]